MSDDARRCDWSIPALHWWHCPSSVNINRLRAAANDQFEPIAELDGEVGWIDWLAGGNYHYTVEEQ